MISVIIPTFRRADALRRTLASLSRLVVDEPWEVIVVDNDSGDHTPQVVSDASSQLRLPVRYVLETERGRSAALNAGLREARGETIAVTDDDVRVESDWLRVALAALAQHECDYVAGKVVPIWGATPPNWLPMRGGKHWAAIALLDYGDEAGPLGNRAPLGVNMVFRRRCFTAAGLWDNTLGRREGTLLGQEVREWGLRARAAGLRAFYVPTLVVHHEIPADRLTTSYFRRWFYWHGVSRAILYEMSAVDMEAPEESTHDFRRVPHVLGVPRYLYRSFLARVFALIRNTARRDVVAAFEDQLWCCFYAGIAAHLWRRGDRRDGRSASALPTPARR